MQLSTHTLTTFRNMLNALGGIVDKAAAQGDGATLIDARIAPDMLPLATQFRMIANFPLQALNSVAGTDIAANDEDPATLEEAKARITETLSLLGKAGDASFMSDDTMVDLDLPNGMKFKMSAADYVADWVFPNFYFHFTTAYAILRANGVELGKADVVPHMMRHLNTGS